MSPCPRSVRAWIWSALPVAWFLVAGATGQPTPAAPAAPAALAAQIDALFTKSFPANAPGATALVVQRGQILLRNGYGSAHLELDVAMKPEHVFRLGSITKQFTAVAILQLVEAGKIKLEDDITLYVPDVRTDGYKITLSHLLSHTSGIPSFTDQPAWRASPRLDMTLAQELEFIKDQPWHFTPGTDWRYSNTGYRLLGAVIEKVAGQTYAEYMDARIFKPAGMTYSSYDDTARVIKHRIPGYSGGPGGQPINAPFVSMTQPHAAGALVSNVDDLWRWQQALESGKLVGRELLARAFASARLDDDRAAGYGFGWSVGTVGGRRSIEHGGGIQGFSTYALSVPEAGVYIAVLCNSDQPKTPPAVLVSQIAAMVLGPPPAVPAATVPEDILRAYAGVYRVGPVQKLGFAVEGDRLLLTEGDGGGSPLDAISPTEFLAPASEARYIFPPEAASAAKRVLVRPRAGTERYGSRVDESLQDQERPAVPVPANILDQYVGDYELFPNFVLSVKRDGEGLTAQATNQPRTTLVAESPTRFRVREAPAAVEFKIDPGGLVAGIVLYQNGNEVPGKRLPPSGTAAIPP